MIAHRKTPDTSDVPDAHANAMPGRTIWLALMFVAQLGRWRPISRHETEIDAAFACVQAFQPIWLDILDKARVLRALIQHPEIASFAGEAIGGEMLARHADALCKAIDTQDLNVARLLDEPNPDDNLDEQIDEFVASVSDDITPPVIDETVLRILDAIQIAPETVVDMLVRVHETTPNQLMLTLLQLVPDMAYPGRSLHLVWHKPLPAFMRMAYRLRASTAALDQQPVGSYLDFCAQVIARSQYAERVALRLLRQCQPDQMDWPDYLASLSEPDEGEGLDDGTIVHFGDHSTDVDVEPMRLAQSLATMILEQQRQPDEHEANVLISLLFLEPEFAESEEPLPQHVADALFVRCVRNSVVRVHQHRGTLISEEAIERACIAAREALCTLSEHASVVQEPMENAPTPRISLVSDAESDGRPPSHDEGET